MGKWIWAMAAVVGVVGTAFGELKAPGGLMVNLLRKPEEAVIVDSKPRFSWVVKDDARGAVQGAYRIQVGEGEKVVWDSGKVGSDESVAVGYGGKELAGGSSYWWQVKSWDREGKESEWSGKQVFNVGDLGVKREPGERRWVKVGNGWGIENQEPVGYHEISANQVKKAGEGRYFVDFGKAAFGTLRVTIDSPEGGKVVKVHLGEKRNGDGVERKPGGSIYYGVHSITLEKGKKTYELVLPRHVSKMPHSLVLPEGLPEVEPYRYAELEGVPGEIGVGDVKQVALFYEFDDGASSFASSDPDLNAVWEISKYTMKGASFMGTYTDGVRERMPYEADCLIQMMGHHCVDREYAIGRGSAEFLYYNATWPTEWILHSVMMAYADWMATGDAESLRRNYEVLRAKTLGALEDETGLISTRTGRMTPEVMKAIHYNGKGLKDITDWPQPSETDGFVFADYNAVVNAFYYRALWDMGEIADALGKKGEAKEYKDRAGRVWKVFNRTFFDPARGVYVDGKGVGHASLHANAIPLALGLVRKERIDGVAEYLKGKGMACGPYGAQFLVEGLYDALRGEEGLALLTSKTDRSWMNMIRVGSTMTTEAWDIKYKKNLTWNHAWGAAPANLIPRKLMGVEPIEAGFRRVRIRPMPGSLTKAELRMPTVRGEIFVGYHREGEKIRLDVKVPANVVAKVWVPTSDPASVTEGGGMAGVKVVGDGIFEIGGGEYHFNGKR